MELFVDGAVLERMRGGAGLRLNKPVAKEIAATCEKPWEWQLGYPSVVPDGKGGYFLYYRGMGSSRTVLKDECEKQVTCVNHSKDGVRFERVDTGFAWEGHRDTNIVYAGFVCHNFTPFYDTNPRCLPSERFKALGGVSDGTATGGLYALASEDGIRWRLMCEKPIFTDGAFDSQNVAFYDAVLGKYRMYSRYWSANGLGAHEHYGGFRAIQSCVSDDFLHWGNVVANDYGEEITEHFYTNATIPCPGAEHILLSFPNRFMEQRKRLAAYEKTGVSDTVFMTSRDGVTWTRRFRESWLRPGLDDANWTDRNMMVGAGIAQTPDGNYSLFCTEHNCAEDNRIRRLAIRKNGFVSLSAGWEAGAAATRPFLYEGGDLRLNVATSAAGSVKAWLTDADGEAMFVAPDIATALYGDALDEPYPLATGARLVGKRVRLCFELKDADVYSYDIR